MNNTDLDIMYIGPGYRKSTYIVVQGICEVLEPRLLSKPQYSMFIPQIRPEYVKINYYHYENVRMFEVQVYDYVLGPWRVLLTKYE